MLGDHSLNASGHTLPMSRIFTDLSQIPTDLTAGAVAVGNFDGVHVGHALLIAELVKQAKQVGGPAVILTFNPPPIAILRPEITLAAPLTTIEKRAQLASDLGVSGLVAFETDQHLLALTPQEFFEQIIVGKLNARAMVEGPNFRFGKDRQGDITVLQELCSKHNVALEILDPKEDEGGEMVSSTRIRRFLANGEIERVNSFLTQPYAIQGRVAKGSQRGRELGFPTANLEHCHNLLPAPGVYAGEVLIGEKPFPAAINIGANPTFGEDLPKFEVHLIGWSGDLYGRELECKLLKRVRDIVKFSSVSDLKEQLEQDIQECEAAFRFSANI